jgi:ribonuclease HII
MKIRIGIDEVGRGCLAGPVTVCAVSTNSEFSIPKGLPELRDSKKMTRLQREAWYRWIIDKGANAGVHYIVYSLSAKMVDKLNIMGAASLAAWMSLEKLLSMLGEKDENIQVVLDGSLFLKSRDFQNSDALKNITVETITGADSKFDEVKMAAVFAKVARDNYMKKMAEKYMEYGFDKNKGYGTSLHIKIIREKRPITGFHRNSFLKNIKFN